MKRRFRAAQRSPIACMVRGWFVAATAISDPGAAFRQRLRDLARLVGRDHDDDEVRETGDPAGSRRPARPLGRGFHAGRIDVVGDHVVTLGDEMAGHFEAHRADADNPYSHRSPGGWGLGLGVGGWGSG